MADHQTPWKESGYGRNATLDTTAGGVDVDCALDWTLSAKTTIRDYWPINEVPPELVEDLKLVGGLASQFRDHARKLVQKANDLSKQPKATR